jgi:hypothetical protein
MTLVAAFPEQPDDAYGFLEPLLTDLGLWPAGTDDVFVEVLACPDAEKETSFHHRRRSGSGVGRQWPDACALSGKLPTFRARAAQ